MPSIPLMKSAFLRESQTKKELAEFILNADRLSMGNKCEEFEKEFCKHQETNYSVLFNSGGSANLAMLQALLNLGRIPKNSKIGFSALTWSTNVMPIIQLGCTPVPIDCDVSTLNIMSGLLAKRLEEENLDVLFITNALGLCGDLGDIKRICDDNNIILIEDNCESLGTRTLKGKTGNFGDMSSFSFFVAHHMSTIEGGMVCTSDDELNDMLRMVRANGWDRNLPQSKKNELRRHHEISDFNASYTFFDLGYNLRPTEITGFLGINQLKYLDETLTIRERNFHLFNEVYELNPDFIKLDCSHIEFVSNFAFPVICNESEKKNKYINSFQKAGVELRPMIAGNIQEQPFFKKYVDKTYDLRNTEKIDKNGFYFGNYPELSRVDIEILTDCLSK